MKFIGNFVEATKKHFMMWAIFFIFDSKDEELEDYTTLNKRRRGELEIDKQY